ncbi:EamA family transporter [Picrophilus oshimae]|uniref:Glucose uptake protein GlcU n=1 Tax=Picrophilus torridus (strain ATCC 700027 / DSM 9790 / JCM 10055 / NBRC 100828 / KAW 2/3) TaxID=1122961 RepID=A0A8G2FXL3_PICTO|nr:EamA family transporter [Picrophilus oshimae]SMD31384.1 Glucose uptake protein GlcU [Picrophilus oshimae DSM 9789]
MIELALPFIVLLIWTASNSLIKSISGRMNSDLIAVTVIGAGIIPMIMSLLFDPAKLSDTVLFLGISSGFFLGLGYILFYKSLKSENLGSAGVTINMQQVIIISFSLFVLKERVSSLILPAVILIITGSLLVTLQGKFRINKYLLLAAIANISWGIYYMPLSFAILSIRSSYVPLLIARISGFVITLIAFESIFMYKKIRDKKGNLVHYSKKYRNIVSYSFGLAVVAGILDGTGNVFYSISISSGFLVIAGALVAILPATLAITGSLIFKEKLSIKQLFGIILSIAGALLIV